MAPGADHAALTDAEATQRYFAKFSRIIRHLRDVAERADARVDESIEHLQLDIIESYLIRLDLTFRALSYRYLMSGRGGPQGDALEIDRKDSGFPVFATLLRMATDMAQVDRHLASLPSKERLKSEMVSHILSERSRPTRLQYAMSQRVYYEILGQGSLFLAQNHPEIIWLKGKGRETRRYLIHWAVYDSETSLPVIYVMVAEDSGRRALPRDERRWPAVQDHLIAQSVSALKLLTIARGFDQDFDDLHPKFLRRIHVGPMYSHAFTEQSGPLRDVLAEASGKPGFDWALSWTTETLVSDRHGRASTGWFSSRQREVFDLSNDSTTAADAGVTRMDRSLILPLRAFQVLSDLDPAGFRDVRKYVVGDEGVLLSDV